MKLSELIDKGILKFLDSFKVSFYDSDLLDIVPVHILTPYYLDMSVRRFYVVDGELLIVVEKE